MGRKGKSKQYGGEIPIPDAVPIDQMQLGHNNQFVGPGQLAQNNQLGGGDGLIHHSQSYHSEPQGSQIGSYYSQGLEGAYAGSGRPQSAAASSASYSGGGYWQVTPRRDYHKAISRGGHIANEQIRAQKESAHWERKLNRLARSRPVSAPSMGMAAMGAAALSSNPYQQMSRPMSEQTHNNFQNSAPAGMSYNQMNPARPRSYVSQSGTQYQQHNHGYGAVANNPQQPQGYGVQMPPSGQDMFAAQDGGEDEEEEEEEDDDNSTQASTPRSAQTAITAMTDMTGMTDMTSATEMEQRETRMVGVSGGTGKFVLIMAVCAACFVVAGLVYSDPSVFQNMFAGDGAAKASEYGSGPTPTPTPAMYAGGWMYTSQWRVL